MTAQIFVAPAGSINDATVKKLEDSGIVVVITDRCDIDRVRLLQAEPSPLPADVLLKAAVLAVHSDPCGSSARTFLKVLADHLKDKAI